ncbi:MAG: hypothetical protein FJ086_16960 [Deltaproteobacteria bacterium]|nr:hypothetical protein [Deltaproteobacteria bacterium]
MGASSRRLAAELLEVVTVGFPFCVFKAGVGWWCVQRGAGWAGAPLLLLAAADAVLNGANVVALVTVRRRRVPACVLSAVTQRLKLFPDSPHAWLADFGNALDMLLAFTLVAGMVGSGVLREFDVRVLAAWNGAVVLNVLGAGLGRVGTSLERVAPGGG